LGCLGVHFALTEAQVKKLRRFADDEKRLEYLQDEIEEELLGRESEWAFQTDKAWDAIHRSLTDGDLTYENGEYPLSHVILGGEPLYFEDDYIMSLKTPQQVSDVAKAIQRVTQERLRSGYRLIDSEMYGFELTDDDFEYTWSSFQGLPEFWARAAAAGRYVLFTADQ
jgi:uncharacterized protein DUF1877